MKPPQEPQIISPEYSETPEGEKMDCGARGAIVGHSGKVR